MKATVKTCSMYKSVFDVVQKGESKIALEELKEATAIRALQLPHSDCQYPQSIGKANEPIARVTGYYGGRAVVEPLNPALVLPVGMALHSEPLPEAKPALEPVAVHQWRVGNLLTLSDCAYPGMGEFFVQVWQGDDLIARVYGDSAEEVRNRANLIAAALPPDAAAQIKTLTEQRDEAVRVADGVLARKAARGFLVPEDAQDLLNVIASLKGPK